MRDLGKRFCRWRMCKCIARANAATARGDVMGALQWMELAIGWQRARENLIQ